MKYLLCLLIATMSFSSWSIAADVDKTHEGIEMTVNINTASAEEIATMLQGVGEKRAQDIVAYREEHGQFKSIEELTKIKGIGNATLEKNQGRIDL